MHPDTWQCQSWFSYLWHPEQRLFPAASTPQTAHTGIPKPVAASLAVLGVLNIFKFFDKDTTEFSIHSPVPKSVNDLIFKFLAFYVFSLVIWWTRAESESRFGTRWFESNPAFSKIGIWFKSFFDDFINDSMWDSISTQIWIFHNYWKESAKHASTDRRLETNPTKALTLRKVQPSCIDLRTDIM